MRDLAREKCVARKVTAEIRKKLQRARFLFFPHIRDREQDAGEGCEIVSASGCSLKIGDSTLLVGRQAAEVENPSDGGCHAADDVFAESGSEQCVVAVGADREQLLRSL